LIRKYPDWNMEDRNLLHRIDFKNKTIKLQSGEYPLRDSNFPTIDPDDPYKLTAEETELIQKLKHSFVISDKLRKHMYTMLSHGAIYGVYNGNLLYHASMPLNDDGSLKEVTIDGEQYKGRALLNQVNKMVRSAFDDDSEPTDRKFAIDYFWYLWCGPNSPLFDKSAMTTFERYFIDDKNDSPRRKRQLLQATRQ